MSIYLWFFDKHYISGFSLKVVSLWKIHLKYVEMSYSYIVVKIASQRFIKLFYLYRNICIDYLPLSSKIVHDI